MTSEEPKTEDKEAMDKEESTKEEDTKEEDIKEEGTKEEDTKEEDTKEEDTKEEDTKEEDTKEENTKEEDTKKEDTKKDDTNEEDTKKDDTKNDDTKKDETKEEEKKDDEEVHKSVAERLKFFFSDANIRQDYFIRKFLMIKDKEDENGANDQYNSPPGSIPIEILLKFNTIKQYTTDPAVIIKVVKTMMSERLVLKDDDKLIARVKPFTEKEVNQNIPLSLYVKHLPTKDVEIGGNKVKRYAVTMEEVRKLFECYGTVALVKLRFKTSEYSSDGDHTDDIKVENAPSPSKKKARRKYPLGACLVEFESMDTLEKAAADVLTFKDGEKVEPKRKLELGDNTLKVLLLKDYLDRLRIDRKRPREEDKKKDEAAADDEPPKEDNFKFDWKPGCVVKLQGLPESCDREAILDAAVKACGLSESEAKDKKRIYADYSRGQKEGAVRFENPDLASKMFEKLKSGEVDIAGAKMEDASLLEGDAEKKYWDEYIQFKNRQFQHRKEERGGKGKHNKYKKRRGPR